MNPGTRLSLALCLLWTPKKQCKPNTQEGAANIQEGAAELWSPAKADLGDEQATVLSVCQDAHQRKGGVRRKDEVSTAVGGLQSSQREV